MSDFERTIGCKKKYKRLLRKVSMSFPRKQFAIRAPRKSMQSCKKVPPIVETDQYLTKKAKLVFEVLDTYPIIPDIIYEICAYTSSIFNTRRKCCWMPCGLSIKSLCCHCGDKRPFNSENKYPTPSYKDGYGFITVIYPREKFYCPLCSCEGRAAPLTPAIKKNNSLINSVIN